jgi:preprotein translocase subunit YajC
MLSFLTASMAGLPWLLAQGQEGGSPWGMMPAFLVIGVLFYLMLIRPQRREQQQRQAMIEAIKKNDRVVTVGGMYGVVSNVRKELDQVYLTVDEKNGTVVRVTMGSIARVLRDEPAADKTESPSK